MKRPFLLLALAVLLSVTGCQQDSRLEISPAPIHEVTVTFAKSLPPQVIVYIKGGLKDGCTAFHDLTTSRRGSQINIKVTVQTEKEKICTQVYGFFEKTVNLGSNFTSGQTYTVNVNDQTAAFVAP